MSSIFRRNDLDSKQWIRADESTTHQAEVAREGKPSNAVMVCPGWPHYKPRLPLSTRLDAASAGFSWRSVADTSLILWRCNGPGNGLLSALVGLFALCFFHKPQAALHHAAMKAQWGWTELPAQVTGQRVLWCASRTTREATIGMSAADTVQCIGRRNAGIHGSRQFSIVMVIWATARLSSARSNAIPNGSVPCSM